MTRPRYTLLAVRARSAVPGLTALAVTALAVLAWTYTVDDAFITARYARNLASGLGYGMNAHVPSDGVTAPLWLLPGVLASALGGDPVIAAKGFGIACTALACFALLRRLQRRSGGHAASGVAGLVMLLSPSLSTWAGAGLETGAATLLLTLGALCATRRPAPSGLGLGACAGLLAWLRPELALPCAGLLALVALRRPREGQRALLLAAFGAASVIGFRLAAFGDWLPLAFRAKAGPLLHGLRYTAEGVVLATSLAGVALCWFASRRGRVEDRALSWVALAQLAAVALAGGDWMPGYRLLVPVLPIYASLVGVGATRGLGRRPRLRAVLLALALSVPALDLVTRLQDVRASASVREHAERLAAWLKANSARVALVDVGFLGYASGIEVIDLAGLTDAAVARMRGGHLDKRIEPAYLRQRDPDAIVLHSRTPPQVTDQGELLALDGFPVERRVAAFAFVRERFRVQEVFHCAPGYDYVLLRRRSSALMAVPGK